MVAGGSASRGLTRHVAYGYKHRMQVHGSCVARRGAGVLLLGPSGAGKSDLALRLLDRGFDLVADDRVDIVDGIAKPPNVLAGLLEVRGMGIMCFPHVSAVKLALAVQLGGTPARLPAPDRYAPLDLPLIALDASAASAAQRVDLALDCVLGLRAQQTGALVA